MRIPPENAMDPQTALFQQHRQRLFGLAYRMLGTPGDAEDVLHDAWLRWHGQNVDALDDPEAWLVTVTTRLALDRLRRARTERASYTGPWLPEPLVPDSEHPEAEIERSETLTLSFLLLLERLSPEERAAFLLREMFEYSHAEAAAILGIGEDACRQRVHRAKARLREGRPRFSVDAQAQRRMLERFVAAMAKPSLESLRALFADVERPLRTRWMNAINHRVGAFMGKITASPNTEGETEKTGFVNRLFALSQRRKGATHKWKAAFKSRHKKLYKACKYLGILLLIWLVFLAPWPIFR
jgi:RNA polymerase sigma factor (sigma-70 family)